MISTSIDEAKVQKLFPNEDLNGLNEKRICFSYELLKNILCTSKQIRDNFLDKCKEKLIKKNFKSLDFYDVYKIMCVVTVGRYYLKIDSEELGIVDPEKINVNEFNVESPANFTFQKMDDENVKEKIKSLENRFDKLEKK